MLPRTKDTRAQEALIAHAGEVLAEEPRILAAWLEGSFASGSADPWSDVDLHIAVRDEDWDAVFADRLSLLGRIGPVLGHGEASLPWAAHLVFANLAGPVRVDLYMEKLSGLGAALRKDQPRVLFDRGSVSESLKLNWNPEVLARLRLLQLTQGYFFGSGWPVRLAGRGEWATQFANAVVIVNQFLIPAILLQEDDAQFFREAFHNERFLSPARRRKVNALMGQVREAFAGIERGEVRGDAVARAYEAVIGAIYREMRGACAKFGVAYPEEAEREMRDYYRRELGMEISR